MSEYNNAENTHDPSTCLDDSESLTSAWANCMDFCTSAGRLLNFCSWAMVSWIRTTLTSICIHAWQTNHTQVYIPIAQQQTWNGCLAILILLQSLWNWWAIISLINNIINSELPVPINVQICNIFTAAMMSQCIRLSNDPKLLKYNVQLRDWCKHAT